MKVVSIGKIKEYNNQKVRVNGWVYNSRRSGKIGFLSIRDGFGIMQCIVEKKTVGEEVFNIFKTLKQES